MAWPMLITVPVSTLAQGLRRTVMRVGVASAAALWLATAAGATTVTPVQPNPGGEPSLATAGGLLNSLYGLSNLTRVDDSRDEEWGNLGTAEVIAKAKYAGYSQSFGYITGGSGGVFVPLLNITQGGLLTGISAEEHLAQIRMALGEADALRKEAFAGLSEDDMKFLRETADGFGRKFEEWNYLYLDGDAVRRWRGPP